MTQRIKHCNVCNVDFPTMYRIQYKNPKEWVFVCEDCLLKVKASKQKRFKMSELSCALGLGLGRGLGSGLGLGLWLGLGLGSGLGQGQG